MFMSAVCLSYTCSSVISEHSREFYMDYSNPSNFLPCLNLLLNYNNNLLLNYHNLLLDYDNLLLDYNNPITIYYYYNPWINIIQAVLSFEAANVIL